MAKLTPDEIRDILTRYQNGEGTTILGLKFGVDHSSIYYYIKKFSAVRQVTYTPTKIDPYERAQLAMQRPHHEHGRRNSSKKVSRETPMFEKPEPKPKPYHLAILDEPVCRGKSYSQYIEEAKARDRARRFPQLYKNTPGVAV
jgi:hypothetical protein